MGCWGWVGHECSALAGPSFCSVELPGRAGRAPPPPRGSDPYLGQEGGVQPQVAGDDVEAEEVPVDAIPGHGQAVEVLVFVGCFPEELQAL